MLWVRDSINENVIYTTNNGVINEVKDDDFIFIGDSYAEVTYLDTTYVDYLATSGISLKDLSKSGMDWEDIKERLTEVNKRSQYDLLLFINAADFVNYRNNTFQASVSRGHVLFVGRR